VSGRRCGRLWRRRFFWGGGGSNPPPPATVAVSGVSFSGITSNNFNIGLEVGKTSTQTAVVAPNDASNKNVTWESSAPGVASVTPSGTNNLIGTITAVAAGSATITVKTVDGGKTASLTVNVTVPVPAPTITSYTPTSARYGETVTITGTNFSTALADNTVTFNGYKATVVTATATRLTVTVPKNTDASGRVKVTVAGKEATAAVDFTYQITYTISVLAGNGTSGFNNGAGSQAMFASPKGLALDDNGILYVADAQNAAIRRIHPDGTVDTPNGQNYTLLNDGKDIKTIYSLLVPSGVFVDFRGLMFVADISRNSIFRVIPPPPGNDVMSVTLLAGTPGLQGHDDGHDVIHVDDHFENYPTGTFREPYDLVMDSKNAVYITDYANNSIRKVIPDLTVSTVAGATYSQIDVDYSPALVDGKGNRARFNGPAGIAIDREDNLYVADMRNHSIRKITPDMEVTTLAGNGTAGNVDGLGAAARFNLPHGIAVDAAGNAYVTDSGNNSVRKITPAGVVSTLVSRFDFTADQVGSTLVSTLSGIAVDPAGNIYVANESSGNGGNRILKLVPERNAQ
jgi:sugar lactone lactonase YvrE